MRYEWIKLQVVIYLEPKRMVSGGGDGWMFRGTYQVHIYKLKLTHRMVDKVMHRHILWQPATTYATCGGRLCSDGNACETPNASLFNDFKVAPHTVTCQIIKHTTVTHRDYPPAHGLLYDFPPPGTKFTYLPFISWVPCCFFYHTSDFWRMMVGRCCSFHGIVRSELNCCPRGD